MSACLPMADLRSDAGAVDGRVQLRKCLTFLSFSCLLKAERRRESSREREGTCSDPGQIIRNYTNRDTYAVTPSHSQCITHCSPIFHPACILLTAQCHHKGGAFFGRQQPGNIWLCFCGFVCACVCRSPQPNDPRTGRLSWDGGRVTVQ